MGRSLHGEDSPQASAEGRQEDGIWQRGQGQGKASTHHCQGICRESFEGQCLRRASVVFCLPWLCFVAIFGPHHTYASVTSQKPCGVGILIVGLRGAMPDRGDLYITSHQGR